MSSTNQQTSTTEQVSSTVLNKVEEIKTNVQNAISKKQDTKNDDVKLDSATILAQIESMKQTVENTLFKWKTESDENIIWLLKEFQSIMSNIAKVNDANVRNEYMTLFSNKINDILAQYNQVQQTKSVQAITNSVQNIQQYITNLFPSNNKNNNANANVKNNDNKNNNNNNNNSNNSLVENQIRLLLDSIKNGFDKINSINDINVIKEYINILLNTVNGIINIHPSKQKKDKDKKKKKKKDHKNNNNNHNNNNIHH